MMNPRSHRCAFTLIELLVVVAILIILVGVLTTAMQPVIAGKEVREAARGLNAFIAGSVARAAETGRPAGIWIQRSSVNNNMAFEVFFAEVPPLYAGDTTDAAATFTSATTVNLSNAGQATVTDFINVGDRIRFFYAGPWYEITAVSSLSITFAHGTKPAPPPYTDPVPFQIQRGPRPSPVQPFQMPADTIIDLSQSGLGDSGTEFSGTAAGKVVIVFSPDGSVDRYYIDNGAAQKTIGMTHLLVGRADQLGAGNLASLENRWVSIGHQTGRVITTENMGNAMTNARQFAISGQGMGGR